MNQDKKNINETNNKTIRDDMINGMLPFIIIMLIEFFFKYMNGGILAVLYTNSNSLVFSVLIGYFIYAILVSLTKKNTRAIQILCIMAFVLLLINQIKIIYTGQPIYFSDINFLGQVSGLATMLSSTILFMILQYLFGFVILAVIFIMIMKWAKKHDFEFSNKKARIMVFATSIIIIVILFHPIGKTKDLYLKLFFDVDRYTDYNSYTNDFSYYLQHTLLSGMYGVMLNDTFTEPQDYNRQEIENIIQKSDDIEKNQNLGKPNIILVFSEAFWDIEQLEEITFDKPVTSNFNRLKQEGQYIELLSCAYGGMSENVAFELLTGGSLNYFTKGYIPVMSLYKRENSMNIPSMVKELKNNHYYSKIVFGKDYYGSRNAFQKMGFDEYLELQQTTDNTKGEGISDEYMTDLIIQEFESKPKDKPIFYMAETIQNHMPYTKDKYENYDIQIENSNLGEETNETLHSYAQGIYDADKQLNRLYEYIKQYKEPTILIFLGDHLPYLYTKKGENAIEYLEFFNTSDELQNVYRRYNTQALVLANYNIKQKEMPPILSNDLLLTYIINNMDIEISNYYKWQYSTIQGLPAYNPYLGIDKDGNKYFIKDLTNQMKAIYLYREKIQYKFFIEAK